MNGYVEGINVHSSTDCALYVCTREIRCVVSLSASANACKLSPRKSISPTNSTGLAAGTLFVTPSCPETVFRGGPPSIASSTLRGSGMFAGGTPSPWRLRPAPFGTRGAIGRLAVEEVGETRDRDEDRGFKPGLGGNGPGPGVR